jgi:hypothetical protein
MDVSLRAFTPCFLCNMGGMLLSLNLTLRLIWHGSRGRSRGTVSLRSDDPWDMPKVDIGFLTDKEGADLATLRCAWGSLFGHADPAARPFSAVARC